MRIFNTKAVTATATPATETAELHQWAVNDLVLVRFVPNGNLDQSEYYTDGKKPRKSENWVWFLGRVGRIYQNGDVFVKFFDGDTRRLDASEKYTDMKRASSAKVRKKFGEVEYEGEISNTVAYSLFSTQGQPRALEKVAQFSDWYKEMLLPVAKLEPDSISDAYTKHKWIGSWLNVPIYDVASNKHIVPGVIIGFTNVAKKPYVLVQADTPPDAKVRSNWVLVEVFDRNFETLSDKLEGLTEKVKTKMVNAGKERLVLKDVIALRRKARKSTKLAK